MYSSVFPSWFLSTGSNSTGSSLLISLYSPYWTALCFSSWKASAYANMRRLPSLGTWPWNNRAEPGQRPSCLLSLGKSQGDHCSLLLWTYLNNDTDDNLQLTKCFYIYYPGQFSRQLCIPILKVRKQAQKGHPLTRWQLQNWALPPWIPGALAPGSPLRVAAWFLPEVSLASIQDSETTTEYSSSYIKSCFIFS